jgi:hypothetical protein
MMIWQRFSFGALGSLAHSGPVWDVVIGEFRHAAKWDRTGA